VGTPPSAAKRAGITCSSRKGGAGWHSISLPPHIPCGSDAVRIAERLAPDEAPNEREEECAAVGGRTNPPEGPIVQSLRNMLLLQALHTL